MISHADALNVNKMTELWTLAKIVKDMYGDSIWEVLFKGGYNPRPFHLGYSFNYQGLYAIYFSKKRGSDIIRFAIPKLIEVSKNTSEVIARKVNVANSIILESKFAIIGNEVWLIHERFMSESEDCDFIVRHILENLKKGADMFYKIL